MILVVRDQFLDHLQYLSNTAFKYAQARLGEELTGETFASKITEEQEQNYLKEM